jgi:hypothetical protein
MGTEINRFEVSRALAKAIAYKNCGKDDDAAAWAGELVRQLGCAGILRDGELGRNLR